MKLNLMDHTITSRCEIGEVTELELNLYIQAKNEVIMEGHFKLHAQPLVGFLYSQPHIQFPHFFHDLEASTSLKF